MIQLRGLAFVFLILLAIQSSSHARSPERVEKRLPNPDRGSINIESLSLIYTQRYDNPWFVAV